MSQHPAADYPAPPEIIYIIRHGEKPDDPPPVHGKHQPGPASSFGVDLSGSQDAHSLLPRGWQRSGALTVLFGPAHGPAKAGLRTPVTLLSPSHGDPGKTATHRTYQTIQGLADRLGLMIGTPFEEGHEPRLAASVVSGYSGVVLICWDHNHIPALASAFPAAPGMVIPKRWPGDRFDVIWAFTLLPGTSPVQYAFSQIPQQLLPGDTDTIIPT
ncbi:MAG: hypothetical protein ACRDOI_29935 [Trebonia sp.]